MAFDIKQFRQQSGHDLSGGHRMFTYVSTADALAAIDTAGYFNAAAGLLAVGDWIFVNAASNTGGIMRVVSNASGVVDVTDAVAVNTDTD